MPNSSVLLVIDEGHNGTKHVQFFHGFGSARVEAMEGCREGAALLCGRCDSY